MQEMHETLVQSLDQEDPLEKEMAKWRSTPVFKLDTTEHLSTHTLLTTQVCGYILLKE